MIIQFKSESPALCGVHQIRVKWNRIKTLHTDSDQSVDDLAHYRSVDFIRSLFGWVVICQLEFSPRTYQRIEKVNKRFGIETVFCLKKKKSF